MGSGDVKAIGEQAIAASNQGNHLPLIVFALVGLVAAVWLFERGHSFVRHRRNGNGKSRPKTSPSPGNVVVHTHTDPEMVKLQEQTARELDNVGKVLGRLTGELGALRGEVVRNADALRVVEERTSRTAETTTQTQRTIDGEVLALLRKADA